MDNDRRDEGPKGLGDFQRRANRGKEENGRRGWDATDMRSERRNGRSDDGPSVRVPNVGWDSTPRSQNGWDSTPRSQSGGPSSSSGWGSARNRQWDAPTPVAKRGARGGSPEDVTLNAREWEEEQVRLDRDWYMTSEGGALDEEYNPLAQYDDLDAQKTAELASKQVVSPDSARL